MQNVKVYIRGWLGYFGIASMKSSMKDWTKWLLRRFRDVHLKTEVEAQNTCDELDEAGHTELAFFWNRNARKSYWTFAGSGILTHTIINKRLAQAG